MTSERLGKQHIGFSICISQSVGRAFTNFSVENKAKVQDILAQVCGNYSKY